MRAVAPARRPRSKQSKPRIYSINQSFLLLAVLPTVYHKSHRLSCKVVTTGVFHVGGEFPRPRHSADRLLVCASCLRCAGGRYAPNLNYTRLGSESPPARNGHSVGRRTGKLAYQPQLSRRPTVRLSSRRSPMPLRVAPIVGAWGFGVSVRLSSRRSLSRTVRRERTSVSTPIVPSAARRARPGMGVLHVGGRVSTSPAQRTRSLCLRKLSALCRGRYAPNLN
jgi:hypothetical protein